MTSFLQVFASLPEKVEIKPKTPSPSKAGRRAALLKQENQPIFFQFYALSVFNSAFWDYARLEAVETSNETLLHEL